MLKELILIENNESYQFSNEKELIEHLLGNNYYNSTEQEKKEQMKINGILNCANSDMQVIDIEKVKKNELDREKKFIIYNEMTYVLSLLLTNRYTLLERVDTNIYTKGMNKTNIKDNYIIVNTFAQKILSRIINNYLGV